MKPGPCDLERHMGQAQGQFKDTHLKTPSGPHCPGMGFFGWETPTEAPTGKGTCLGTCTTHRHPRHRQAKRYFKVPQSSQP